MFGLPIAIIVSAAMIACASVNTVRYFAPSIEENAVPRVLAADGLSFFSQGICLHVADASKGLQMQALGPLGLPVIPVGLANDQNTSQGFVDLIVWLVPARTTGPYTFDPTQSRMVFSDGSSAMPNVVQVSRFKVRLQRQTVYLLKAEMEEVIYYPEHWGPKPLKDFTEPIQFWDWSRFRMRFEKPSPSAYPRSLTNGGLSSTGGTQELPTISFTAISKTIYAMPGRFADGTSVSEAVNIPWKPCRKLEANPEG
jgi:hypothetical protein